MYTLIKHNLTGNLAFFVVDLCYPSFLMGGKLARSERVAQIVRTAANVTQFV